MSFTCSSSPSFLSSDSEETVPLAPTLPAWAAGSRPLVLPPDLPSLHTMAPDTRAYPVSLRLLSDCLFNAGVVPPRYAAAQHHKREDLRGHGIENVGDRQTTESATVISEDTVAGFFKCSEVLKGMKS